MVDTDPGDGEHHFRFVKSKGNTMAAKALVEKHPSQKRIAEVMPRSPDRSPDRVIAVLTGRHVPIGTQLY